MKHILHYKLFESDMRSEMNLESDFQELNRKIFNNELKRVPMRWMESKHNLGLTSFYEDGTVKDLAISYLYKMTRQQYLDTLAHEMIHVWMAQKNIWEKNPHGPKFMRKASEINNEFPEFNITDKHRRDELANDLSVNTSVRTNDKTYGVVLFETDGEYSVVPVEEKALTDESVDAFVEGLKRAANSAFLMEKSVSIQIYKIKNSEISRFKVKRALSLKSMQLWAINEDFADVIRRDGELVREETIK